jgi:hypothetical protein
MELFNGVSSTSNLKTYLIYHFFSQFCSKKSCLPYYRQSSLDVVERKKSASIRQLIFNQAPWTPLTMTECWGVSQIQERVNSIKATHLIGLKASLWVRPMSRVPTMWERRVLQGKCNKQKGAKDVILNWVSSLERQTWRICPVASEKLVSVISSGITCADLWH